MQVVVRQREPLCHTCLEEGISAKTRACLRSNGLIRAGDVVALAYSGGHASALLLHLLCGMRSLNTSRPEKRKVPFTLHVIHIDESEAYESMRGRPSAPAAAAAASRYCSPPGVSFHSLPLHAVLGTKGGVAPRDGGPTSPAARLAALLDAIPDATGRDDTLRALRTRLLLRAAGELGARGVALGCSGTRLAAQALAEACKGRGRAAAAGARLVDGRHGGAPLLLRPLRDTSTREVAACAHALHLPAGDAAPLRYVGRGGVRNINLLAEDFVLALLAANPSAASNVMSVLDRLEAFPWSEAPDAGGDEGGQRTLLCMLCLNPLGQGAAQADTGPALPGSMAETLGRTCPSCRAGVLGDVRGRWDAERAGPLLAAFAAIADQHGPVLAGGGVPSQLMPRESMHAAIADCLL